MTDMTQADALRDFLQELADSPYGAQRKHLPEATREYERVRQKCLQNLWAVYAYAGKGYLWFITDAGRAKLAELKA